MIAAAVVPGVQDLDTVSPFLREFGVAVTVLFVILFFLLIVMSIFLVAVPRRLDGIEKKQVEFNGLMTSVRGKQEGLQKDMTSFRDSEHDCLRTLKHICDTTEKKTCEISDDVAVIATALQVQAEQYKANHEKTKEIYACLMDLIRKKEGSR
ncbi:MAG: hypothetical protein AB2L14_25225 [Candidatus Xenobiia bacterium LiM19]